MLDTQSTWQRPALKSVLVGLSGLVAITLAGCLLGTYVLNPTMVGYDTSYQTTEADLLLLNVARGTLGEPPHFMILTGINNTVSATASLSALFDWTAGVKPPKGNLYQLGPFGAAATESPLFNLVPIQGQDFFNHFESPLTDKFAFFMLRDRNPWPLTLLMGDYFWVTGGEDKDMLYKDKCPPILEPPGYWCENDPKKGSQQDKFWDLAEVLQDLKDKHLFYVEKLGADLDADEIIETSSKAPTVQEYETATKDGYRWVPEKPKEPYLLIDYKDNVVKKSSEAPECEEIEKDKKEGRWVRTGPYMKTDTSGKVVLERRSKPPTYKEIVDEESVGHRWVPSEPYQLIDENGKVKERSPHAPTCEDIAEAEQRGQRWVPRDEKPHRLKKNSHVVEEWADAPTPRDIAAATKAGYHWDTIPPAKAEATYKLIQPAHDKDKMFALLDFDMRGPNGLSGADIAEIRENVQPDPQDFVYVELRGRRPEFRDHKAVPKIKGYIKIRTFGEILQFLADSSRFSDHRQFIGSGDRPPAWTPDRLVPYKNKYVWLPSSQGAELRERDLQAFYWLYTLYQLSVVDTTKLPQVPVTISK